MKTTTLHHFQVQAAKMLIEGYDYKAIGIQIGKDPITIRRWVVIPEFAEMLNAGRQATFSETAARLATSSLLAACTLESVMIDPESRAVDRLKAADLILTHAVKFSENIEIQNRLHVLEVGSNE